MKKTGPLGTKIIKIIHIILAAMWVGGGIALVVMVNALKEENGEVLSGYLYAMKIVDDFIIIPGAMGSLLMGFVYGIFTGWGFFRFRWVTVKWILTVAQILFGTFVLGPLLNGSFYAAAAGGDYGRIMDDLHSLNVLGSIQVLLLLFMVVISVLRPWKKAK